MGSVFFYRKIRSFCFVVTRVFCHVGWEAPGSLCHMCARRLCDIVSYTPKGPDVNNTGFILINFNVPEFTLPIGQMLTLINTPMNQKKKTSLVGLLCVRLEMKETEGLSCIMTLKIYLLSSVSYWRSYIQKHENQFCGFYDELRLFQQWCLPQYISLITNKHIRADLARTSGFLDNLCQMFFFYNRRDEILSRTTTTSTVPYESCKNLIAWKMILLN